MRNGNFYKEKSESIKEKFSSKSGIFDFLVGSFIFGFIVVQYNDAIFNHILNIYNFLGPGIIQDYISYITFGAFFSILGLGISFILHKIFNFIFNGKKVF